MRNKLIEELAYKWRYAENSYLETKSDNEKRKVLKYQNSLNLTEEEIKELHEICNSMGV
jgi:hypothetical protein